MRTTTHVMAVTAAFLTTWQRCVQRLGKKRSCAPVTALLAGFLIAVLAPTAAFSQHTVGSLYFLNQKNGSWATGYLDRYGFFHQTPYSGGPDPGAVEVGVSRVVNTPSGLLVYRNYSATSPVTGWVLQIWDEGNPHYGPALFFSGVWTKIVSIGNYLFFYGSDRSGMIGYIGEDGKWTQTVYYSQGSLPYWTHVVATENNLFFYDSTNGSGAVGYIWAGFLKYSQQSWPAGSLPVGSDVVGHGKFLLFYNPTTGAARIGMIDHRPGQLLLRWGGSLPVGYNTFVWHGRYLILYNPYTGQATIGYVDLPTGGAKFTVTQQPGFSPWWNRIVSIDNYLLFYDKTNGSGAVGWIDDNGQFQQTSQVLSFSPGWDFVVATSR